MKNINPVVVKEDQNIYGILENYDVFIDAGGFLKDLE